MDYVCCYRAPKGTKLDSVVDTTMPSLPPKGTKPWQLWEDFKTTRAALQTYCPTAMPVVVRFENLPNTIMGLCSKRPSRFVIRLNALMREPQAVETLVHEWAHALAWNYSLDWLVKHESPEVFEMASHDAAWGCAYSRTWRVHLATMNAIAQEEINAAYGKEHKQVS